MGVGTFQIEAKLMSGLLCGCGLGFPNSTTDPQVCMLGEQLKLTHRTPQSPIKIYSVGLADRLNVKYPSKGEAVAPSGA